MRKDKVFSHDKLLPRMSWSARNLYNLLHRSVNPSRTLETQFETTSLTVFQQRARSRRMLRSYHGDHIPEKRFKRWFLPVELPSFSGPTGVQSSKPRPGGIFEAHNKASTSTRAADEDPQLPIAQLFLRDIERRLDTAVFRCCFARSIYEARTMVVHGKVKLNGTKMTDPNQLLEPGDLLTVDAESIYMLSPEAEKLAKKEAEQRGTAASDADAEETGDVEPSSTEAASTETTEPPAETQAAGSAESATQAGTSDSNPELSSSREDASVQKEGKPSSEAEAASPSKRQPHKAKEKVKAPLPEGVRPFHLPPFAAPFLFVPPYLEVSFATCSAIYLRHPTVTSYRKAVQQRDNSDRSSGSGPRYETVISSDLPTPYAPTSELFSLAWEHYTRNAPRVRSDSRRLKLEASVGTNGFDSARAADEWKKMRARRRGATKKVGQQGRLSRVEALRKKGAPMRLLKTKKNKAASGRSPRTK